MARRGSGRFVGMTALVSGGASGIGSATARRLAAEGAAVVVMDLDGEAASVVAAGIAAAGGESQVFVGDARDPVQCRAAVAAASRPDGRLDVIVGSAGIARHGDVADVPTKSIHELFDTHVLGLWHLVAAALPTMRRHKAGAIVAVTSVHAFATLPLVSAYAGSKAAVLGLVRGLALDLAPDGIRVNAVAPGSVDTPMLAAAARRRRPDHPESAIDDWAARHPIGRILKPDEVASAISFLASSDASGITGVCLPVDGGLLARLAL